jgi:hypothetical protein
MAAYSTYGTLLKENTSGSYVTLAGITKLDPPKISNKSLDSTTLDSGNWGTKIFGNLINSENLKFTGAFTAADFTRCFGYCASGCALGLQIALSNGKSMTFSGGIESFNPGGVDSKSPELQTAELEVFVSGSIVLA